jgi:Rrf2 family protein
VLQRLVRSGLLVSTQGTRGGYTLRLPAASISVSDVIQAIDGPFSVTACSTENSGCDQYSKCSVRDPLWQIRERIAAALATVSVAELAADQIKGEGLRPDAETVSAPVAIMRRASV